MDFWFYLNNFSAAVGILGTTASIFTYFKARKLQTLLNNELDKKIFKEEYMRWSGEIEGSKDILSHKKEINNEIFENFHLQLESTLAVLESKFPFLSSSTKKYVKKIRKILNSSNTIPIQQDTKIKLIRYLISLETILTKEGTK